LSLKAEPPHSLDADQCEIEGGEQNYQEILYVVRFVKVTLLFGGG